MSFKNASVLSECQALTRQAATAAIAMAALIGALAAPAQAYARTHKDDAASAGGGAIKLAPTPSWVVKMHGEDESADTAAPWYYALDDTQIKVDAQTQSRYVHVIRVLSKPAGVEQGSQFQVDFDPSYQRLLVHHVSIWRDGKRIDKFKPGTFKLLQRETQLEQLVYDGRVTAAAVLDDVRVGDRIDYDYTVEGQNPVFGSRFVAMDWGVSVAPVGLFSFRVLASAQRHIQHREATDRYQVSARQLGDLQEIVVQRHHSPQLSEDKSATAASYLDDLIQFSEYQDWKEVAAWAQQLFVRASVPEEAVAAQAMQLTAGESTAAGRIRRVLDFVQADIRYFGTEIGANSHLPATAATVLSHRYGDCKDKTALLVAMLKSIGVAAEPVLVSVPYREQVKRLLPSPLAFDHVIARVHQDDQTYWLDSTRSHQSGALPYRSVVGYGQVLVADASSDGLTDSPGTQGVVRQEGRDVFHFESLSEPPVLTSTMTFHGDLAETVRSLLGSQSLADLQKGQVGDYARLYPAVEVISPMTVEEDVQHNAITLRLQLRVPDFLHWTNHTLSGDYALQTLMSPLRLPGQGPRDRALNIAYPGIYRHEIIVETQAPLFEKALAFNHDDHNDQFEFHLEASGEGKSRRILGEVEQLSSSVEVADWPRYKESVTKVWPHMTGSLLFPVISEARLQQLRKDLAQQADAYKAGRSGLKSQVQVSAQIDLLVLQAALDENRLPPKVKAQVYEELGSSQDHLGHRDEAHKAFEAGLALDDKDAGLHQSAGINAILRRDFAAGERQMNLALQLDPNQENARLGRVWALFYEQKYDQAREDLLTLLKSRSAVDSGYGALWLYLTSRKLGNDGVAAVKRYESTSLHPAWPQPVVRMFSGSSDYEHALAAASEGDKPDAGKLCELYFFRAMKDMMDGDAPSAQQYFKKSVDTGIVEYMENAFSQIELDQIRH